ncbi:hypothetical protein ACWGMK_20960 [Agrobacterium deltaense]
MRVPLAKRPEDMQFFAKSPYLPVASPSTRLPETFSPSSLSHGRARFAAQATPETLT